MRKYKLIQMFDVDKLYTYNYSTREIYENQERANEIKAELKEFFTSEAKAGRAQYKEILEYMKANELDENTESELQNRLKSIQDNHKTIKLLREELQSLPKIVIRNDKKSNFNKLLDLHLAIFDNPDTSLWKEVLSPNGFGELKRSDGSGVANDIYNLTPKNNSLNYLSQQYQVQRLINGSAGKAGVGVFSSSSMLLSMLQGRSNVKYVKHEKRTGDKNLFKIIFGESVSTGNLSDIKTLKGQIDKTRAKVIEAFQSASVDNENEQILHKINVNAHTFNVINALATLGFDEVTISYFISQPIIKLYVDESIKKSSSLKAFEENYNYDLFESIKADIESRFVDSKDDDFMSDPVTDFNFQAAKNYGVSDLKKMLSSDVSLIEDREFAAKQLGILDKFKELDSVGMNLQSLMQTLNIDSKGMGKTMISPIIRIDNQNKLKSNEYGSSGVDNAGELLKNSIPGIVSELALPHASAISRKLFLHSNRLVFPIIEYLGGLMGSSGKSASRMEDFSIEIVNEIKSYLFSKAITNSNGLLSGESIDDTRKRLFIDEYEYVDGRAINVKKSLASRIRAMQEVVKDNLFLSQIFTKVVRNGSASIVGYRASAGLNLDESEMHQSFMDLYLNDREFKYNDGTVDRTRDVVKDLIRYTYMSGGIQEAIQFVRYIPIEVLSHLGFNDSAFNAEASFNDLSTGTVIGKDGVESSYLAEQIVQHNYKSLAFKLRAKMIFKEGNKNALDVMSRQGVDVISSVKLSEIRNGYEGSGMLVTAFAPNRNSSLIMNDNRMAPYVSVKTDQGWLLYKYDQTSKFYNLIPILGVHGMKEYNALAMDRTITSSIKSHNAGFNPNATNNNDKSSQMISYDQEFLNEYNMQKVEDGDSHVEHALNLLINSKDKTVSSIANDLLNHKNILEFLSGHKISFGGKSPKNGSFYHDGRIIMYEKKADGNDKFTTKEKFETSLAHEILHAYKYRVADIIEKILSNKELDANDAALAEFISEKAIKAYEKLTSARRAILNAKTSQNPGFKNIYLAIKAYEASLKTSKDVEHLYSELERLEASRSDSNLAYALQNNKELISKFNTESDILKGVNKSFIERVLQAIGDILGVNKDIVDFIRKSTVEFISEIDSIYARKKEAERSVSEPVGEDISMEDKMEIYRGILGGIYEEAEIISTTIEVREYTPENISVLKPNEVFVFGANTAGGHGGGTAGLAQRGTTSSNYTALPVGTKGKWSEYGVVDKLMYGNEGKSFGIVTKSASITGNSLKIGSKRSVSLDRIKQSILALIDEANNHPELKFLVTKFGTNMAGFTINEIRSLFDSLEIIIPDNIILPKEFEVRPTTQQSTSVKPVVKDLSRWANIKDVTTPYTDKGIVVTRVGNTEEQFGNPFIGSKRRDKQGNPIESKVDNITVFNTIDEADQAYRDWLMGAKHQNIKPIRRQWILKQINEGKLDGKTLLYYKPMEVTNNDGTVVKGGYHSHADTLAEIVEELRSTKLSTRRKEDSLNFSELSEIYKTELIEKHGSDAIEVFNSLTEEEQIAIIKCL